MTHLVIYHKDCTDGFGSAWAARKAFLERDQTAEYFPMHHGDAPPEVAGKYVYICDFSLPKDILLKMAAEAASLVVLDHHKTAEQDLKDLDFCVFDMNRSGAALTWDYFFNDNKPGSRHWIIDYIQDRDLWHWKLADSKEISDAIFSYPQTFETWDEMAAKSPFALAAEGKAISRYKQKQIDSCMKAAYPTLFDGHEVMAVNTSLHHSEVTTFLSELRTFGISWSLMDNGKYRYSLRSSNGFDVSAIAKKFGGGGHAAAAGFISDQFLLPRKI